MQVILKKDGWYCKLQEFVFGRDRSDFSNLCPFFWLTIFCIMASPFVMIARIFWYVFKYVFRYSDICISFVFNKMEKIISYMEERYCNPFFENQISQYAQDMTDQDAYNLFFFMYGWEREYDNGINDDRLYLWRTQAYRDLKQKKGNKYLDRFDKWKELIGDNWAANIKAIRGKEKAKADKLWDEKTKKQDEKRKKKELILEAKWGKRRIKKEQKAAAVRRRNKMYNNIITYTRILVWLPGGLIALFILYWSARLGLVIHENWSGLVGAMTSFVSSIIYGILYIIPWILGIGLVVITGAGLGYIIVKLVQKCNISLSTKISIPGSNGLKGLGSVTYKYIKPVVSPITNRIKGVLLSIYNKIATVFKTIGAFFSKIGLFFTEVGAFFVMYAKAVKTNYCPYIEWKEKGK